MQGGPPAGDALPPPSHMRALSGTAKKIQTQGRSLNECVDLLERNDPMLIECDLSERNLVDEDIAVIACALEGNNVVTTLNLRSNNVGDDGAERLARMLSKNRTIERLDLPRNAIGPRGARALGEALQSNKSIRELSLLRNRIGPEGAKTLAESLKSNESIRELVLLRNGVGDAGARAIADMLKKNNILSKLGLSYNDVGNEGARELADAFRVNHGLQTIHLWGNSISDDGANEILAALDKNQSLVYMGIEDNALSKACAEKLEAKLAEKRAAMEGVGSVVKGLRHTSGRRQAPDGSRQQARVKPPMMAVLESTSRAETARVLTGIEKMFQQQTQERADEFRRFYENEKRSVLEWKRVERERFVAEVQAERQRVMEEVNRERAQLTADRQAFEVARRQWCEMTARMQAEMMEAWVKVTLSNPLIPLSFGGETPRTTETDKSSSQTHSSAPTSTIDPGNKDSSTPSTPPSEVLPTSSPTPSPVNGPDGVLAPSSSSLSVPVKSRGRFTVIDEGSIPGDPGGRSRIPTQ